MSSFEKPIIRNVVESDAEGISEVLSTLAAAGKRTKPSDAAFALAHYISDPERIRCCVAVAPNGEVLGFQSLKLATENDLYGVAVGWGIIGTHIKPAAARRGVGRALFDVSLQAARQKELPAIDATIGDENEEGLGYYEAMGFRDTDGWTARSAKFFAWGTVRSASSPTRSEKAF